MRIFVITSQKSLHQRSRVEKIFSSLGMPFQFVTDGDISNFNEPLLSQYFVKNIKSMIREGAISCTLNHFFCYKKIIEENIPLALIFEDDLFLLGDFKKNLTKIVEEASLLEPGFIVSLENSTLEFPRMRDVRKNKFLYPGQTQRCTGGYLIDRTAATNGINHLKQIKCDTIIDLWHTQLIQQKMVKMYWAHPPIVEQGSHNGRMPSTIYDRGKKFRRIRWLFQKYYKMYVRRLF
jgi:glycosyl transferase, family 25